MSTQDSTQVQDTKTLYNNIIIPFWTAFIAIILILVANLAGIHLIRQSVEENHVEITIEDGVLDSEQEQLFANIEQMNERSEDAIDSAQNILSFLEGTAILVGIIIGIGAFLGITQFSDVRNEFDEKIKKIEELSSIITAHEDELKELDHLNDKLENGINSVTWLLQADQEFRLRNNSEAYNFANKVLQMSKDNPMALYILGWLKVHTTDEIDEGIENLETLQRIMSDWRIEWPTAQASYAVALRRKARKMTDQHPDNIKMLEKSKDLLETAEARLVLALKESGSLMDFNKESYWGPLGGIRRDLGKILQAIDAYRNALKITPGSSYPQGNLASLYLIAYHEKLPLPENLAEDEVGKTYLELAEQAFHDTREFAIHELVTAPNDYYNLMDIAMSYTMLGHSTEGKKYLHRALGLKPAVNKLEVSLISGWEILKKNCPTEWDDRIKSVDEAVGIMQDYIKKASA